MKHPERTTTAHDREVSTDTSQNSWQQALARTLSGRLLVGATCASAFALAGCNPVGGTGSSANSSPSVSCKLYTSDGGNFTLPKSYPTGDKHGKATVTFGLKGTRKIESDIEQGGIIYDKTDKKYELVVNVPDDLENLQNPTHIDGKHILASIALPTGKVVLANEGCIFDIHPNHASNIELPHAS